MQSGTLRTCSVFPFKLIITPLVFTCLVKIFAHQLSLLCIDALMYLDDMQVMTPSLSEAVSTVGHVVDAAQRMGFQFNLLKSCLVQTQSLV